MKRALLCLLFLVALPALAALPDGAKAPMFTAKASLGGKVYSYSLAKELKKGPVVVYFYPAAFTPGCTIEAHDFAEAMPKYKALGASVIGVSHDPIAKLKKFSVSECRSKFPVASDKDGHIMKDYDSVLPSNAEYANRTSYVIAPDGTVIYSYTAMNPDKHVENTLGAIRAWRKAHAM
ncbi:MULTISPECIES: peroxiredoxin [Oleiagrimonas]|jgi:thioredoxin-dependent peroxiredoxin|uniref:thioredoxin-dependent peroxiredoxin n=1 Tax=Oleiagrimonas citrea TaxID=1665687 RepID=A0A846ZMT7_9GAMM|nr:MULTISPECIES: peroxiredoxin [Oleiagrimonas]NKZ38763.1 peroxiredoxin [Oleiagrimonas citrea]RAP59244.1 peroxiredoxin [Oleiagrimonas sp. MCCC 1A03011]